jgi:hypothetical protein
MGLLRAVARTAVIAGTATAVSNRASRRLANRWAQDDQSQYADQAPPPQAADSISQGVGGAEGPGDPHRGGVCRAEGKGLGPGHVASRRVS